MENASYRKVACAQKMRLLFWRSANTLPGFNSEGSATQDPGAFGMEKQTDHDTHVIPAGNPPGSKIEITFKHP
jgi:hypothetical protein